MARPATIPCTEIAPQRPPVAGTRPKGRILAKDGARGGTRSLHHLGGGRVLLGFTGGHVGDPRGVQLRAGGEGALAREIIGPGGELAPAPGARFALACGAYEQGDEAACHVVDLESGAILDGYPLRKPYVWLAAPREDGSGGRFVAQTPPHLFDRVESTAAPALVSAHPEVAPLLTQAQWLVEVDRDAGTARAIAGEVSPYAHARHVCLSPDGGTLYAATTTDVVALDLETGAERWRQAIGTYGSAHFVSLYALSLSADGKRLATGGIGSGRYEARALVLLDAGSGAITWAQEMKPIGGTSIGALAWHPSGWLAAGSSVGAVAHVSTQGTMRVYQGALKGIEALLFVEGALLVGGSEKQLRRHELVADEGAGGW